MMVSQTSTARPSVSYAVRTRWKTGTPWARRRARVSSGSGIRARASSAKWSSVCPVSSRRGGEKAGPGVAPGVRLGDPGAAGDVGGDEGDAVLDGLPVEEVAAVPGQDLAGGAEPGG